MKRKIVYLSPTLCNPDGIERVLIGQANYLAEQLGYEVTIILTDGQGLPYSYPISPLVRIIQLNVGFYNPRSGGRIHALYTYIIKMRQYHRLLEQQLIQLQADVVITTLRRELHILHKIKDGSRKIGWAHLNCGSYRQVNFGPWRLRGFFTRIWQHQFYRQLRHLDTLVVLTDEDKAAWKKQLDRVVTIPNPLSFQTDEVSPLTAKQVVAVGRYAWQKGFDRLITIWKEVHFQHPDWVLRIYGRGDRRPLQQLIDQWQLTGSCFLHPYESDVTAVYQQSSIFAFPSRYEGFGLVLTEAMHCGLPCVSFDCPCGPKDIITDGTDGFLVHTPQEFAAKLSQLMSDEALRERMARQARQASFRYTAGPIMKKWEELFNNPK